VTCAESFECPEHQLCDDTLCVADTTPVIECSGPGSCAAGKGCFDGKCLETCKNNGDCGFDALCQFGYCHPKVGCMSQADCAGGDCLNAACQ
jgi:hypothetical protein